MRKGFIEIPESPVLHGEEAIRALQDFIDELEQKKNELADKQSKTLIKIAKVLIVAIEAETWSRTLHKKTEDSPRRFAFLKRLNFLRN